MTATEPPSPPVPPPPEAASARSRARRPEEGESPPVTPGERPPPPVCLLPARGGTAAGRRGPAWLERSRPACDLGRARLDGRVVAREQPGRIGPGVEGDRSRRPSGRRPTRRPSRPRLSPSSAKKLSAVLALLRSAVIGPPATCDTLLKLLPLPCPGFEDGSTRSYPARSAWTGSSPRIAGCCHPTRCRCRCRSRCRCRCRSHRRRSSLPPPLRVCRRIGWGLPGSRLAFGFLCGVEVGGLPPPGLPGEPEPVQSHRRCHRRPRPPDRVRAELWAPGSRAPGSAAFGGRFSLPVGRATAGPARQPSVGVAGREHARRARSAAPRARSPSRRIELRLLLGHPRSGFPARRRTRRADQRDQAPRLPRPGGRRWRPRRECRSGLFLAAPDAPRHPCRASKAHSRSSYRPIRANPLALVEIFCLSAAGAVIPAAIVYSRYPNPAARRPISAELGALLPVAWTIGLEVPERVHCMAVDPDLEVEVVAEAVAGAAHVSQDRSLADRAAGSGEARLVRVAGGEPAAVVDAGVVPVAAVGGGEDDRPGLGGPDRGPGGRRRCRRPRACGPSAFRSRT